MNAIRRHVVKGGLAIFGTRGYDQGSGFWVVARKFLEQELGRVDTTHWRLIRDARLRERQKASVVVFEKRTDQ